MPDLDIRITGVTPVARGLTPLLYFKVEITLPSPMDTISALILQAQVQLQPAQRTYTAAEKERLVELFNTPEHWGQTLRNRLWIHTSTTFNAFTGRAEGILPVPCTYDLNFAATKYFYALENGEIPLLFLFNGSIFYLTPEGLLQVQPIAWDKEAVYRMPVKIWRELMEFHYPGSAWISLQRDVFDQLVSFKRHAGLPTWEQTIQRLLESQAQAGDEPTNPQFQAAR
jgi:hypothetical protein